MNWRELLTAVLAVIAITFIAGGLVRLVGDDRPVPQPCRTETR